MKKGITTLLIVLLSTFAVFAQGGSESGNAKNLRFTFFGNLEEASVAQTYSNNYCASHPGVNIEFEAISQGDLDTKMIADHIAGNAPDVIRVAHTQVKPWASKGILLDIKPFIERDSLDYMENALDVFSYQDGIFAFPKTLACRSLLYNEDMFDVAGIPYPTDDWTWEDLKEAAKKLTIVKNGRTTQWGFLLAPQVPGMFGMFVEQAGGTMFEENGKAVFNSKAGVKVLDYWNDLVFESKVSPTPKVGADMNYEQGFKLGQIAMIITGPWNRPVLASDFPELHYGVAEAPHDVAKSNNLISDGIGVWQGTKNKELAVDFAEYVASYEAQKIWWDSLHSHFPATKSGIQEILNAGLKNDSLAYPFIKGLEYSKGNVWNIKFLEYQPILVSELQAVLDENIRKDPQSALNAAVSQINALD
jgi:multiple sugar transport system substrate-binding protein